MFGLNVKVIKLDGGEFPYRWRFIGKGVPLQPAQQACLNKNVNIFVLDA